MPRSLHSATVINDKMYVFGGWVPLACDTTDSKNANQEKEWKCTNSLAVFNLNDMKWEYISNEALDEAVPRARAGHSAVAINSRLYIWSGRDGYRKAWNNQVCCKDLWYLETEKPSAPTRVQLSKATTTTFDIMWGTVPAADCYILQIQKIDSTPPPQPSPQINQEGTSQIKKPCVLPTTTLSIITTTTSTPVVTSTSIINPITVSKSSLKTPVVATTAVTSSSNNSVISNPSVKIVSVPKPQVVTTPVSSTTTTGQMSDGNLAALAAAAAATQKISTPAIPVKAFPTTSNIRLASPQILSTSGNLQTVKLAQTPGTSQPQTIRLIGTKQILVKSSVPSGQKTATQIMTVVKPGSNQITLANSRGTPQMVKVLASPNVIKSSGANIITVSSGITVQSGNLTTTTNSSAPTTFTGLITSTSTDPTKKNIIVTPSGVQSKIINNQAMRMIVVPSSSVRTPGTVVANASSGQTVRLQTGATISPKTITIPASALKSASGTQKIILSQGGPIRIVNSATGTSNQRVVLLPSGQSLGQSIALSTVSSNVVTPTIVTTTLTKPSEENTKTNTTTDSTKIPQTDGPDDGTSSTDPPIIFPTTASSNIFSTQNALNIENPSPVMRNQNSGQ